jgi:hypothetical protein
MECSAKQADLLGEPCDGACVGAETGESVRSGTTDCDAGCDVRPDDRERRGEGGERERTRAELCDLVTCGGKLHLLLRCTCWKYEHNTCKQS